MPRMLVVAQLVTMTCVLNFQVSTSYGQEEEAPGPEGTDTPEQPEATPEQPEATPEQPVATPEQPATPALPPAAEPAPEPRGLLDARAAIDEAQYATALQALESSLREGNLALRHLQEVYRLRGETFVAIGKAEEAKESFARLLLLDPEASLGEFASPKIVAVLDQAREGLAGQRLQATHSVAAETRRIEVVIDVDPLSMVAKLRLSYPREDETTATLSIPFENGKAVFDVPAQAGSSATLALLDGNGNALSTWQVDGLPVPAVATAAAAIPVVVVAPPEPRPLWTRWWVWAGATGVTATVATAFAIASSSAQTDLDEVTANPGDHFFREAKELEDKARSRATVANIGFVLAGALGITTGVMYWQGRNSEPTLQIVPANEGTGASMTFGGRF